jgi:hypothetical protein
MSARTMVAGGVAGLGLAIGGLAVASAHDTDPPASSGASQRDHHPGGGHGHGFGHRGGGGFGALGSDLADELGVSEDELRDAWKAVRKDLKADRPDREDGEPPSEADLDAFQKKVAAALAEELDLPQADVEEALEKVRGEAEQRFEDRAEEWRTEARERLVERLDQAIEDGDLTEADKTSVLKAFDAGVLGGRGGGPWFGFGHGHGPR